MARFHSSSMVLGVALAILLCLSFFVPNTIGAGANDFPVCHVESRHAIQTFKPEGTRRPTILFWDWEGVNYEMFTVWFGDEKYAKCPVECRIQKGKDKEKFSKAEAVLFWATPLDKGIPLEKKCPGQLWLQASTEAFDTHILDRTPPGGMMKDGVTPSPIDLEVSWRRSLGKDKVSWLNNYDWNLDFTRAFTEEFAKPLLVHTKTREGRDADQAAVAAFISNCGAISPRLQMLKELQEHIKVDSFGKCAHNKDVPDHWEAEKDLSRGFLIQKNTIVKNRYKFLLSFENQEIEDYVTEKFYHPLAVGVLPIVLGAPNIHEYNPAPPGSPPAFLNVKDFASMQELAARIDYLDKNDTAYMEYFQWRTTGEFAPLFRDALQYSWRDSPCQVCQSIHQKLYGWKPISILPEVWDRRVVKTYEEYMEREEWKKQRKEKREAKRKLKQDQLTAAAEGEAKAKANAASSTTTQQSSSSQSSKSHDEL